MSEKLRRQLKDAQMELIKEYPMHKVLADILKSGVFHTRFGWLGKYQCGETNYLTCTITIGIFAMAAKVFLHERGHRNHPEWDEKRVLAYEDSQYRRMSARSVELLGRRLVAQCHPKSKNS